MRLIKLGLLSIVFLFLVATAVSLLIPSHIRISKAINIHASGNPVFALITDTKKWNQWHPAFIPNDSAKKFPEVMISTKSVTDTTVIMELQQGDKRPVTNGWQVYHISPDSLTLQWYMDFYPKWYPWQKFGSLFYENTYGVLMEQGLSNIKRLVQQSQ